MAAIKTESNIIRSADGETPGPGQMAASVMREPAPVNGSHGPSGFPRAKPAGGMGPGAAGPGAAELLPLLDVLLRRWYWLLLAGVACAFLGFTGGMRFWRTTWTAPAQLLRYDSPNASEVFGNRQSAAQTLPSLLHSPELLQRVGAEAGPPLAPDVLAARLRVMPEHDSDIIVVTVTGRDPSTTVDLVNRYAREAVNFTQRLQARAANEVIAFTSNQLAQVESQIAETSREAANLARPAAAAAAPRPSALADQLQTARGELYGLLSRYTDAHPLVQEKRAQVAALQSELEKFPKEPAAGTNSPAQPAQAQEVVQAKLQVLENARLTLIGRRQAAEALAANPPGYCQLLATATTEDLVQHGRLPKIVLLAAFLGLLGFAGSGAAVLSLEVMDNRVKNAADLKRVTRLPVLACAGNLDRLSAAQRERWAFRAWTSLQGRLSPSPNHGLVCGVTSAGHGEGRSTWLNLLAGIANQQGFRVLTITTRPAPGNGASGHAPVAAESTEQRPGGVKGQGEVTALAANFLATPAEVTRRLMGTEPQPIVQIPLPGWVWNLERRKQWQAALQHWSEIENVVILVELPPAAEPEAVLLGQNLPNLIWLAASGKADSGATREHLETLRQARCRLAGAVLNRAPTSIVQRRFRRWLTSVAALAVSGVLSLPAAENPAPDLQTSQETPAADVPRPNLLFGVASSAPRAEWQRHLTLGPGDILNFALYGEPTLAQTGVPVGPDGRVSFLEAQDVAAAGLTVDELRARMDEELAKYRRAPHTMITPVAFNSKKYFLLGSVVDTGVFTLDHPLTIIEAVARAHGLQTALQQHNLVEITDLQRAFLVREGKRLAVDFEKLFARGDLSQNAPLAPGDYLYFPPADLKEVYVVGEVGLPGVAAWAPDSTALRAIAEHRGFTDRAWKKKVLVVRGSLSSPQTFVVDASAVLAARTPDFRLEPGDIVYVHRRPWVRAEELVDFAATAFVQAAVIVWTGLHAGPLITTPVIR